MSLPREILLRRLSNELKECSEYLGTDFMFDPGKVERFPITIDVTLSNVLGYESKGKIVTEHGFTMMITEEYGQRKPEVRWRTQIFHPNIMDPKDGGYVCIKLLNEWSFGSKLLSFIKGVENLVSCPNYKSPFGTDSCMAAAEFFKSNMIKFEASVKYDKNDS